MILDFFEVSVMLGGAAFLVFLSVKGRKNRKQ